MRPLLVVLWGLTVAPAADWHVTPAGRSTAAGTAADPWDLPSTLAGQRPVRAGDTIWVHGGTYVAPRDGRQTLGYPVALKGGAERPLIVRASPGERATIDGGLNLGADCAYLWLRDLEVTCHEEKQTITEPGSHPAALQGNLGGITANSGPGLKFINLIIHHNTGNGMGLWKDCVDAEVSGCVIYGNGWQGPDRHHGHGIYTQNEAGTKIIAGNIIHAPAGGSQTIQAYGSARAFVDNFRIEDNIAYGGGRLLIGGGRPSRGIVAQGNLCYGLPLQLGYSAPENEDCEVVGNVVVRGGLTINKFKQVVQRDNLVWLAGPPADAAPLIRFYLNRHDPDRAHLAVVAPAGVTTVDVDVTGWLTDGQRCRLDPPEKLFEPVPGAQATARADRLTVTLDGEFTVRVVRRLAG